MTAKKTIYIYNTINSQYDKIEVSEEIAKTIKQFENKENYLLKGLKSSQIIKNSEKNEIEIKKSREVSIEFLEEKGVFFESEPIYRDIEKEDDLKNLLKKISKVLNSKEYDVIFWLIFVGLTEKEYAKKKNISQSTVHYRKESALKKLKKYYEDQKF